MQATIQVLLKLGKAKLTTTCVADRAGVSVGTLYQYFPNKGALLQALVRQKLDRVALAMETACAAQHGRTLVAMAEAVSSAFVAAKFQNVETSIALYAASDSVEGKRIAADMQGRWVEATAAMLKTACDASFEQPGLTAATLCSAMAGVSRAVLEAAPTASTAKASLGRELTLLTRAYLVASSRPHGFKTDAGNVT